MIWWDRLMLAVAFLALLALLAWIVMSTPARADPPLTRAEAREEKDEAHTAPLQRRRH